MKKLSILSALLMIFAISCNKSDDSAPDNRQLVTDKAVGVWNMTYAELDGNALTDDFTGFGIVVNEDLTFTSNSSAIIRQPNPWAASGSFTLPNEITNTDNVSVSRNDGAVIMFTFISDTDVVFSFSFSANNEGSNGRTSAVEGEWVFEFTKN